MTYDDWKLAHPPEYDEAPDDDGPEYADDDTPDCRCGQCSPGNYTCISED